MTDSPNSFLIIFLENHHVQRVLNLSKRNFPCFTRANVAIFMPKLEYHVKCFTDTKQYFDQVNARSAYSQTVNVTGSDKLCIIAKNMAPVKYFSGASKSFIHDQRHLYMYSHYRQPPCADINLII